MSHKLVVVFFLITSSGLSQSIQITEVMTSNDIIPEPTGSFYPWIELKNISEQSIDLSGFTLREDTITASGWPMPAIMLPPGGHQTFWLSGMGLNGGQFHTDFTLIKKSIGLLLEKDGVIVDSIKRPFHPNKNESLSRNPLNSTEWLHFAGQQVTYNAENSKPKFWKKLANKTAFNPRDSSPNACLVFNNKMWIMAGYRRTVSGWKSMSDVWSSDDGINWKLINPSPPYNPYSAYVVFNEKMWAFDSNGGWSSTDGALWQFEATYPGGAGSRIVSYNDQLFFTSGNYIGRSTDGRNWQIINFNAPWGSNRKWPAFLVHNSKMFYMGGGINYFSGNDYYYNDVWTSTDGINWTQLTPQAEWPGRYWFNAISFDNKIWLMGGWNYYNYWDKDYGNQNDIWVSEDGITWKEYRSTNKWPNRHAQFTWTRNGALYISSGYGGGGEPRMYNDVWVCEPKLDLSITAPEIMTYGDESIPVTESEDALVETDNPGYLEINNGMLTAIKPGFVKIKVYFDGDHIYYPFLGEKSIFINKKSLIIAPRDTSKFFGAQNPIFNIDYQGFAFDDTIEDLDQIPTASTSANEVSYVGEYRIDINEGSSRNYELIRLFGTLTINPINILTPFPNPANSQINFALPYKSKETDYITLYNTLGEVIRVQPEIGENAVTIPLSFQPGLYFYIVKNNNALFQGKFIVN